MKKCAILAAGAALLSSNAVMAEGMYFEADYMKLDMEWNVPVGGFTFDASPPAIALKLGSAFNPYFSLEAMLAFGIGDDDFVSTSDGSLTGELNSIIGVNALGTYPVADNVQLYGKLGFAQVDIEGGIESPDGSASESVDDTGVLFGAGLAINFTRYSALVFEYIQLPDVDLNIAGENGGTIETTSLNLGYRVSF
jgi:hypothetical protein